MVPWQKLVVIHANLRRVYPGCRAREPRRTVHVTELEVVAIPGLGLGLCGVDLHDELAAVRTELPAHAAELCRAEERDGVHGQCCGERADAEHQARDGNGGDGEKETEGGGIVSRKAVREEISGSLGEYSGQDDLSLGCQVPIPKDVVGDHVR